MDPEAPRGVPDGRPHRGSRTSYLMKHISLSDLAPLKAARASLEESETYGSEPDLILVTNQYVILLEAKFTASVLTQEDKIPPYYLDDKEGYAAATFTCDPAQALNTLGYELFRFFLLGEALGRKMNLIPVVVLLTRDGVEPDLNTRVQSIIQKPRHAFVHITWGGVHEAINRIFFGKNDPVI